MSSGSFDDGPCKICGIYTSNIEFKHRQLCRACANKIDNWSKEDILKYQHVIEGEHETS